MTVRDTLARLVIDVPDFPEPGVVFKDITPVLADHSAFTEVVEALAALGRLDAHTALLQPLLHEASELRIVVDEQQVHDGRIGKTSAQNSGSEPLGRDGAVTAS